MELSIGPILPIVLLVLLGAGLAVGLLIVAQIVNPIRPGSVKQMPYESGMDPIHEARRRFDVRFFLLAIAFLVFDVELLFLYPWAVSSRPEARAALRATDVSATMGPAAGNHAPPAPRPSSPVPHNNRHVVFAGAMIFLVLLSIGFIYDWQKGVFQWR